ncbi:MAG TPA: hypothetical protein VFA80_10915 [Xanthobacteraceae bacterium]|nr:hypothetical protein [Xanthobacteraceae bacterium]
MFTGASWQLRRYSGFCRHLAEAWKNSHERGFIAASFDAQLLAKVDHHTYISSKRQLMQITGGFDDGTSWTTQAEVGSGVANDVASAGVR